mgnify:FL=1|jgi:hypothetical protein
MASLGYESTRYSDVIAHEYAPELAFCRDVVTVYEGSEVTYQIGTVLGKTLVSGSATATAGTNTGNGTMGTVTVSGTAEIGTYTLRISKAASNAGDFVVVNPSGNVIGNGTVAVAYSTGGLAFTLADGSTDFVVGDTFSIAVTGTVKYKRVEATATDGSQKAAAIYVGGVTPQTSYNKSTIAATTNTSVVAIVRGNALYKKQGLVFGASVDTQTELDAAYAQLEAKGILAVERIGTFATIG